MYHRHAVFLESAVDRDGQVRTATPYKDTFFVVDSHAYDRPHWGSVGLVRVNAAQRFVAHSSIHCTCSEFLSVHLFNTPCSWGGRAYTHAANELSPGGFIEHLFLTWV